MEEQDTQNRDDGGPVNFMSLRDHFAACAMQALFSRVVQIDGDSGEQFREERESDQKYVAESAYCIADAMLKARGEK